MLSIYLGNIEQGHLCQEHCIIGPAALKYIRIIFNHMINCVHQHDMQYFQRLSWQV